MKRTTVLLILALSTLAACNTNDEEQSESTDQKKEIEIKVKDDSYVPDDNSASSVAEDTVIVNYDIPANYETTILEENGDWYTLKVDFTARTYYVESEDRIVEIIAPVGNFYMTEPAEYDAALLNNKLECPSIVGKDQFQSITIAAENMDIYINDQFFAQHTLTNMRHDFDGQNFFLFYEYHVCNSLDCGIVVRYIIDTQSQTVETSVSEYNNSEML
ncbi:hypothetical protein [Parvicella tangerina]|uniref:Uncharacterized protein n=1 Tax=Parvicella tangerina TaxID=2829795 RepID=A0A916JMX2_9FLAO|nr:hypothetical protein [Parvicella tangerina]CAG5082604.1 hypothetical protein CRYO30217_01962 [Parvicella tangerina]